MTRAQAAADNAFARAVAERVERELLRRASALRQQGSDVDDLGAPDQLAARMLAAVPEPSPWRHLGPMYTTTGIARVLGGVTRQAIEERRRRRRLLALRTDDGAWVYPAFQLDARNQVLRGLPEVLQCFAPEDDRWTIASLLTTPQPSLAGRTPIVALGEGDLDLVLELARDVAARWRW